MLAESHVTITEINFKKVMLAESHVTKQTVKNVVLEESRVRQNKLIKK